MRATIAAARWWIGVGAALLASITFYSSLLAGPLDHHDWSGHHLGYFDWVRVSIARHHTLPLYMADAKITKNFIANAEAPTLGPLVWLLPILGTDAYVKLLLVVFTAAGCVGMFALLRDLGVDPALALAIAPAFAFNGFFFAHLAVGHHWAMGCQLLPWLVLLLRRAVRGSPCAVWGAAVISAFTILGGQHQPFIWQNLFLGAYALLLSLRARSIQPLRILFWIVAWTAGLAAVKLIPMWIEFRDYDPSAVTVGLPLRALAEAFVGRGQGPELAVPGLDFTAGAGWWEYGFYLGPIALLCLVGAALSLRRTWPLLAIGAFFFVIAIDWTGPFDPWARIADLPVWRSQRSPSRFLFIASFALLVAGGAGLERIHRRLRSRTPHLAAALALLLAAFTYADLRIESQSWQSAATGSAFVAPPHHPQPTELHDGSRAVATLHEFGPNRLVYRVVANEDARVVFPLQYAKGARARARRGEPPGAPEWRVEGLPVDSADGKLAVEVGAGEHDVVIEYRPRGLAAGIATSAAAVALLALRILRLRRGAARDSRPD